MKNIISIFIILAVLPIYGHGISSQSAKNQRTSQNTVKPDTNKPVAPLEPRIVINEETTNTQGNRPEDKPKSYFARLIAAENAPNLVLCLVGLAGIIVAICTLKTIQKQTEATRVAAEATEAGVEVQRIAMQQWVDIGNWKGSWEFKKDYPKLDITFDLINPTGLPLTMTVISVTPGQPMNTNKEIPLNPRETYTHRFSLQLTEHHSSQSVGSIWLDFLVFVTYENAFKGQQIKRFGKSCLFNLAVKEVVFEHYRKELPFIFGNEEDKSE